MNSRFGIKDVFLTLQGEGSRVGAKSVFVRFTGCNLWDGNPLHRDQGAGPCAKWCDTDFAKGSVLAIDDLLARMSELWPPQPHSHESRWCVLTGGEPLLQLNLALVYALHEAGWKIAVETNGTVVSEAAVLCDWVCIAPKHGTNWRQLGTAHELKVVLPGASPEAEGWTDTELLEIENYVSTTPGPQCGVKPLLFAQPQDPIVAPGFVEQTALKRGMTLRADAAELLDLQFRANVKRCASWIMAHPRWRMSLQTHKITGMP